jgi:hypothetical protein
MKLRWGWIHERLGREIPLTQVRITYSVDLEDMSQMLCAWLVGAPHWWNVPEGEREASLPVLSESQIAVTIRRELERGGLDLFEHVWSDDVSRRDQKIIETWARETLTNAFPSQAAQTWPCPDCGMPEHHVQGGVLCTDIQKGI